MSWERVVVRAGTTDPQALVFGGDCCAAACGSVARLFWERGEDGLCAGDQVLVALELDAIDVRGNVGLGGPAGEIELVEGRRDGETRRRRDRVGNRNPGKFGGEGDEISLGGEVEGDQELVCL